MNRRQFLLASSALLMVQSRAFSKMITVTEYNERVDKDGLYTGVIDAKVLSEDQMLYYTNWYRQYYGLPALKLDHYLTTCCGVWSWYMAKTRKFYHGRGNVRENIAMGQKTVAEAYRTWMNSSGHRSNILAKNITLTGCACVMNDRGTPYFTQRFM